jgi:hypothetical protein
MTVHDISTDGTGRLRISDKLGRRNMSSAGYHYRYACSGDMVQGDDRLNARGMAHGSKSNEDRRLSPRHVRQLPLTISVFNQGAFFQAQMMNYSQDGVCAATSHPILPGASLHIRIDASQAAALERAVFPELRTMALGEVKWCSSLGEESSPRFFVGIRYYSYY